MLKFTCCSNRSAHCTCRCEVTEGIDEARLYQLWWLSLLLLGICPLSLDLVRVLLPRSLEVRRLLCLRPTRQPPPLGLFTGLPWSILLLQILKQVRQKQLQVVAAFARWRMCFVTSPSGSATMQADGCKAVSAAVITGVHLTMSPMFC